MRQRHDRRVPDHRSPVAALKRRKAPWSPPHRATTHPESSQNVNFWDAGIPYSVVRKVRSVCGRARVTRLKVSVVFESGARIGPGKAALLENIRDTGSISAVARDMGMSYKRAWLLLNSMNQAFIETRGDGRAGWRRGRRRAAHAVRGRSARTLSTHLRGSRCHGRRRYGSARAARSAGGRTEDLKILLETLASLD
jgi:hypothetical protein